MQGLVYFFLILEIIMYCDLPPLGFFDDILARIRAIPIYNNIFFSKLLILFLEILVSIGSRLILIPKWPFHWLRVLSSFSLRHW